MMRNGLEHVSLSRSLKSDLDMIEQYMLDHAPRNGCTRAGFVFPNGSISPITIDHCATARAVAKSLKMNCHNIDPMYYFLSLGVIRIRNNGTLIVESHAPLSNKAENAILDFAAGQAYDTVFIDFDSQYYRQAEFLKKKLEKGMVGRFD